MSGDILTSGSSKIGHQTIHGSDPEKMLNVMFEGIAKLREQELEAQSKQKNIGFLTRIYRWLFGG